MHTPITYPSRLRVSFDKLVDIDDALAQWITLEQYRTSVFLSTAWMAPWLSTVSTSAPLYTLRFHTQNDQLVGMGFITEAVVRRRRFFTIHQLSLNEAETGGNKFIIEYNTLLHDPVYRDDVFHSFFDFLANSALRFDELRINAAEPAAIHNAAQHCTNFGLRLIEDETSMACFTRLGEFASDPDRYLAALSKNKREQIRRSIKYYNQFGEPDIRYAADEDERLDFFRRLGELHQQYWISKGRAGSFANKKWVTFHEKIICDHPTHSQLIRIAFGEHVLGYLYNLIDRNIAYSMQSGFNYSDDKNDRPGIISHFLVTNDYIRKGMTRYEYLAGEAQYKHSLSNDQGRFSWYLIQKKNIKLGIENALLWLKRSISDN